MSKATLALLGVIAGNCPTVATDECSSCFVAKKPKNCLGIVPTSCLMLVWPFWSMLVPEKMDCRALGAGHSSQLGLDSTSEIGILPL